MQKAANGNGKEYGSEYGSETDDQYGRQSNAATTQRRNQVTK
jgi:hypothetical protein